MPNNTTKPKLKPARMITKEKVQEVKDKMADISSTVVSSQTVSAHPADSSEQVEDAEARLEAVARCPHLVVRHVGNG